MFERRLAKDVPPSAPIAVTAQLELTGRDNIVVIEHGSRHSSLQVIAKAKSCAPDAQPGPAAAVAPRSALLFSASATKLLHAADARGPGRAGVLLGI